MIARNVKLVLYCNDINLSMVDPSESIVQSLFFKKRGIMLLQLLSFMCFNWLNLKLCNMRQSVFTSVLPNSIPQSLECI